MDKVSRHFVKSTYTNRIQAISFTFVALVAYTVWVAPHERLPEILVVPREKTPTGAAARGNP